MIKFNSFLFVTLLIGCGASSENELVEVSTASDSIQSYDSIVELPPLYCNAEVVVGAEQTADYFEMLVGKKVGVIGNQSSIVGETHLVDTLIGAGIDVVRVFSPEHGFRGTADAGEKVNNEKDPKTGLPIVSLYGKNKKPTKEQFQDLDVILFDIQDVGVRFYTYISTLHYVMEAAAENGKQLIVLDRPNPNGHYVDGPMLNDNFTSFVGMHKIPVVHGMTIAEYAKMVNGEGWLANGLTCDLQVIKCSGWDHTKFYELPIAPSPNLPNMTAVYLYPSLCFFEGTIVSIGRGTDHPFQMIGHPDFKGDSTSFSFIPSPNTGAKHPKLEGENCIGVDLHEINVREYRSKGALDLAHLALYYSNLDLGSAFFLKNNFIDLLAGSDELRKAILAGTDMEIIKASWEEGITEFKMLRSQYLLYSE